MARYIEQFVLLHTLKDPAPQDAHGNDIDDWDPPDPDGVGVYGWGAPDSNEPFLQEAQERVAETVSLYVYPDFPGKTKDLIQLGIDDTLPKYRIMDGEPAQYLHGPFGFAPGTVVHLVMTEG